MKFRYSSLLLPFLLQLIFTHALTAQEKHSGFILFPQQRLFGRLLADPAEVQLSARLLMQRNQFAGNMGYSVGLIQFNVRNTPVQIRVEGNTLLVTKIKTPDFPVQSTDFTVGLPVELQIHWMELKMRMAHISSHLGDNFNGIDDVNGSIDAFGNEKTYFTVPKKFSREFVEMLAAFTIKGMRVYGGGIWDFHIVRNPSDRRRPSALTLHYGIERLFLKPGQFIRPYLAVDVKQKKEFSWHVDTNVQGGITINNKYLRRMRFAFEWYRGFSSQGQFFRRKENDLNLMLTFDF